jgi:hypothetical protein
MLPSSQPSSAINLFQLERASGERGGLAGEGAAHKDDGGKDDDEDDGEDVGVEAEEQRAAGTGRGMLR